MGVLPTMFGQPQMNIHYLHTVTLELPFRYIISFFGRKDVQCMSPLVYTVYCQKQPSEKRCSRKFRKIHRKTPLVLKLTPFLQNTSEQLLLAFLCKVSRMGYCQHCYHYLETLILEVPFRYITSFFSTINFQHMSSLVYTVYCQKQPSE